MSFRAVRPARTSPVRGTSLWPPGRWSLTLKLGALVLAAVIVASGTTLAFSARATRATVRTQVEEKFALAAAGGISSVADDLINVSAVLRGIAVDPIVTEACATSDPERYASLADSMAERQTAWTAASVNSELVRGVVDPQLNPVTAQLRRHLSNRPDFHEILVTDGSGVVIAASRRPQRIEQGGLAWWISTLAGGRGRPYAGIYRGVGDSDTFRYVEVAVPVYRDPLEDEEPVGAVYAKIKADLLIESLVKARPSGSAELLIANEQGQVVVATHQDLLGSFVHQSWWGPDLVSDRGVAVHEAETAEGTPVLVGRAAISDLSSSPRSGAPVLEDVGWVLFVYEPLRTAYSRGGSPALLALGIGVLLIVLAGGYTLSRTATWPLNRFLSFVQRFDEEGIPKGNGADPWRRWKAERRRGQASPEVDLLADAMAKLADECDSLRSTLVGREQKQSVDRAKREMEWALLTSVNDLVTATDKIEDLSWNVVERIRDQYGLHYVGLYLVDEAKRWAVLQAGTGELGRKMLAQGHRISAGTGIVGICMSSGTPQIEQNPDRASVRTGSDPLQEPFGPPLNNGPFGATESESYARSEMALPMRSRSRMTGVLLAQSYEVDTFDEAATAVFQILADGLAAAIDNARLTSEQREAEERLRRVYGDLTRSAWREMLGDQVGRGYEASVAGSQPLPPAVPQDWDETQRAVWETGEPLVANTVDGAGRALRHIVVPIRVHGEVIGVLDATRSADQATQPTSEPLTLGGATTEATHPVGPAAEVPVTEIAELEELAEQLGLALENARLYERARKRATEERLVGQATRRMRESLSVDAVLHSAAEELCGLLDLETVEIRVGMEETGVEPSEQRAPPEDQSPKKLYRPEDNGDGGSL